MSETKRVPVEPTDLKPCPFCGTIPWGCFGPNDPSDPFGDPDYGRLCWIECHGCDEYYFIAKSREETIAAWNRRTNTIKTEEAAMSENTLYCRECDNTGYYYINDRDVECNCVPFRQRIEKLEKLFNRLSKIKHDGYDTMLRKEYIWQSSLQNIINEWKKEQS